MFTCPVCGYPELREPHRRKHGSPSHEICPCCGTHFGYDDARRPHEDIRKAWIAKGMKWWSNNPPPPDWDPIAQLERAGFPTPK